MAKKTYDPKCADLAREFLAGEEDEGFRHVLTDKNVAELASRIQETIEDFLDELK